jgi:Rieske 2Fe-2S family protein
MDPRQALLSRLLNYQPARPLPREFYTSPIDYQVELEALWYREWLFVGHHCEIPRAGDYLTVQIGEYPVLVVRDRDGNVRAFHNSCRHRGSRICRDPHGNTPRLVCPYHQWTYRLDGELIAARDMGEFDRGQHSLRRVHCAGVGGYIWVCLGEVAPDFEPFASQFEPYLRPHRLQEAKVAFESTIVERANWKLVWENNRECYHCPVNHPELSHTFPATPTVASPEMAVADPRALEQWGRWESLGLPSRFQLSPSGQSRIVRMSLINDAVSYTLDGRAAVRRPLSGSVTAADAGALLMFHYASTWNHVLADHAISFRVLPLGPTETQLTTKWLVHKDAREGVDYDVKDLTAVWLATNEEDRRVCQENQLGVSSPAYAPAPYSPIHEAGVMQFVSWYRNNLLRRLTEAPESERPLEPGTL